MRASVVVPLMEVYRVIERADDGRSVLIFSSPSLGRVAIDLRIMRTCRSDDGAMRISVPFAITTTSISADRWKGTDSLTHYTFGKIR